MKSFFSTFLAISLLFICTAVNGQSNEEMTPYELKREELATKALERITKAMSTSDQLSMSLALAAILEETGGDRFAQTAAMENLIYSFFGFGDLFETDANHWYEINNPFSYYDARQITGWAEISDWYKEQRSALEKNRTDNDIQREKNRIKQSRGIGLLHKNICQLFTRWGAKGEYEKTVSYNMRMNEKAVAAFDSLCFLSCNKALLKNVSIRKDNYDADSETYTVSWNIIDDNDNILSSKKASFHLSLESIAELKKYADFRYYTRAVDIQPLGVGEFDGFLYPTKVRFDLGEGRITASLDGVKPIEISTDIIKDDDLRIYVANHNFNYVSFLDSIVLYDDAKNTIDGLFEQFTDTYKSFNNFSVTFYYPSYDYKEYYSKDEMSQIIANARLSLAENLHDYLWHVYCYVPPLELLLEDIWKCDMNILDERILENERLIYTEAAKSLKEDELKKNLWEVGVFSELFDPGFTTLHKHNDRETLCKILIENNEYLKKKIRVRDSYYDALESYYEKHKF